jgi:TonB family protein
VQPDIRNRTEVARALEENYPPLMRDAGIGGTAEVWLFIDEEGVVRRTQIAEGSGHQALDDAAIRVATTLAFTPALNRDKRVPVWISLPITFATASSDKTPARVPEDISAAPTFTPYTVQPDITNRSQVARALGENYPPLLKDAGIGGTARIWFFIDEEGTVQRTQIAESSGHKALDDAALLVARGIQFTPALNREKPVAAWISLPITFSTH